MENILEYVVLLQSGVLLWLSLNLDATRDTIQDLTDAHNNLVDGVLQIMDMIEEEDAHND